MPQINQLSPVASLQDGDNIPLFATDQGDARRAPLSLLKSFILEDVPASGFITQYAAPSATGFSVAIGPGNVWLILTPTATFAAGTLTLSDVFSVQDGQELLVNCTQIVTALTVAGNGATVTGAPTTLAANDFFRLRFDAVLSTWYRVG